jgi:DNA invertase Pin-like site-specific DNA recombinase
MDHDGPIRQRAAIEAFCKANAIELVGFYEESHTGSDLDGRIEFHKMREAMLENGVRLVIVEKLDRLARSVMIQETILADFKKHEIDLRSATTGEDDLCGEDPTRVLIRQILAAFFEYERKMIELKMRAARQRIKASGKRCEGRKPYGTRPGELDTLLRMETLNRKGMAPEGIAALLNSESSLSRYGKRWNSGTIWKILAARQRQAS